MSIARKSGNVCPELIIKLVRKERNRHTVWAVVFFLLSLTGAALIGQPDVFLSTAIAVLSMIFLLAGFKLLYEAVKAWNPNNADIVRTITKDPESIVWVYSVVTENMPFGIKLFRMATVYFKLADGEQITMQVPPQLVRQVSECLNPVLQHATFGYTAEREQWYVVEPRLLYRGTEKQ